MIFKCVVLTLVPFSVKDIDVSQTDQYNYSPEQMLLKVQFLDL